MLGRILGALTLGLWLGACETGGTSSSVSDQGSGGAELSAGQLPLDAGAPDLGPAAPDSSTAFDFASTVSDLAASDLAQSVSDLAAPRDLVAVVQDLAKSPDSAMAAPDLAPAPDLAAPRDLATSDLAGGGATDLSSGTMPPEGTWPPAWATLEDQILVLVNARRAQGATCGATVYPAAPPLTLDTRLRTAARLHSRDMANNNYFSHTGLNGSTAAQRIAAAGYTGSLLGENIAAGNATAAATMTQWMNSAGHCANIMRASYKHLGVGYAYSASSTFKHYWTQTFGG